MTIPTEIIATILAALFAGIGSLVVILINVVSKNTKAYEELHNMVQDIVRKLAVKDTEDKYEAEKCETVHGYIREKFKKHDQSFEDHNKLFESHNRRINKLENESKQFKQTDTRKVG
jgi:hypothetical protein